MLLRWSCGYAASDKLQGTVSVYSYRMSDKDRLVKIPSFALEVGSFTMVIGKVLIDENIPCQHPNVLNTCQRISWDWR